MKNKNQLIYFPEHAPPFSFSQPWSPELTVQDMLLASGIHDLHPETKHFSVGIFANLVDGATLVKPGDRIEVYRPLKRDPKEKRRLQAKLNRDR